MDITTRIRTVLTALVTWLTVLAAVLSIVVDELADYADVAPVAWVIRIAGVVLVAAGVAVNIVRRVTPVIPADRGLLPLAYPTPDRKRDAGQITGNVLGAIAFVVVVFACLYVISLLE
jgi:hypothetical protein